jgi:hypothetical protein
MHVKTRLSQPILSKIVDVKSRKNNEIIESKKIVKPSVPPIAAVKNATIILLTGI